MRLRQSARALSRCSADVLAGRYRLDGLVGSGGAAEVHRGLDLRLERAVAVKLFRTGADADMEERFHNEAVILARLQHPGLVTVYDAGRHNGRPYLVMQLVEGPTLKDRIAAGPLTTGEAAALGSGLARALAHAHAAGIVHRDVKPSNILLDTAGRPHLTDFGISRLLDTTSRTATGVLIGTAAYLSPEQVLGRSVGPAADVYALGLVLLECLTGRLEYDGGLLEAAIARLHRPPVLPPSVPEDLAALLADMTALDEQARPSAEECARRLAALAGAHADSAAPPSEPRAADVTSLVPGGPGPADGPGTAEGHRGAAPPDAGPTHAASQPAVASHPAVEAEAAPKAGPARARVLVAGGAAALAAVLAGAFAFTDGSADHGGGGDGTRTVSRPAEEHGRSGAPADGDAARRSGSATPTVSEAAALRSRDTSAGRRSGSPTAGSGREPATDAAAHSSAAPPPSGPGGPAQGRPAGPPTHDGAGAQPPGGHAGHGGHAGKPAGHGKPAKEKAGGGPGKGPKGGGK